MFGHLLRGQGRGRVKLGVACDVRMLVRDGVVGLTAHKDLLAFNLCFVIIRHRFVLRIEDGLVAD